MSALSLITNAITRAILGNRALTKGVLAINAAGAATVKTTNAIVYTSDGILYSKAALAAQSIAVTHDCFGNAVAAGVAAYVQPAGKTVHYLLSLTAAGTVQVSQGSYAGQSQTFAGDPSKVLTGSGGLPKLPDGATPFGLIKVVTANAATFNPGTTLLDAADVTATYHDLAMVPATAP